MSAGLSSDKTSESITTSKALIFLTLLATNTDRNLDVSQPVNMRHDTSNEIFSAQTSKPLQQ